MKICYALFICLLCSIGTLVAHDTDEEISFPQLPPDIISLEVGTLMSVSVPATTLTPTSGTPPQRRLHKRLFRALYRLLIAGAGIAVISRNKYRWGRVVDRRTGYWVEDYDRRRSQYHEHVDHILEEWEYGNPGYNHIQQCRICRPTYNGLYRDGCR